MSKKYDKVEVKKDCFAYNDITEGCGALDCLFCKYEICKFYKTKEQLEAERKAVAKRLKGL